LEELSQLNFKSDQTLLVVSRWKALYEDCIVLNLNQFVVDL
jgi:hypothetical protein